MAGTGAALCYTDRYCFGSHWVNIYGMHRVSKIKSYQEKFPSYFCIEVIVEF